MSLIKIFKSRACIVLAAIALLLCLVAVNAVAHDIDDILWDIQTAICDDDGDTVVRLIRENRIDINGSYYLPLIGVVGVGPNSLMNEGYATALSSATSEGSTNVVKALIDAGADVNALDRDGSTALSSAGYDFDKNGAIFSVRILINNGADLNAQDNDGETALMGYADKGFSDLVKILIDAGADVNIRNNKGETALIIAERSGYEEAARLLRNAGAR